MIVSIFGYENKLKVEHGQCGVLNLNNPSLYKSFLYTINNKEEYMETNYFVFSYENSRLKYNEFIYVDNILSFEVDEKRVITKIIGNYIAYLHYDEEQYQMLYNNVKLFYDDFINYLNLEEIEFYGHDVQFESLIKAFGFDFNIDTIDAVEKIEAVINIYSKFMGIKHFVFNNIHQICLQEELARIEKLSEKYNIVIILLENMAVDEVVIKNCLTIDKEYAAY